MTTFCSRYPNVKVIDVVNEPPPHTTPPYASLIGGAGASGYDWIVNAFKWARAACPGAVLVLNDYNTIEYQTDHDHFISIVQAIKTAGAPIDAVGAQGACGLQHRDEYRPGVHRRPRVEDRLARLHHGIPTSISPTTTSRRL